MRVLVDQNISHRAAPLFFEHENLQWQHVKDVGLTEASDAVIWTYAEQQKHDAILSADQDFYHILLMKGIPPKLIWLRIGNGSYQRIAAIVNASRQTILSFLTDPRGECLEIWP